MATGLLRVRKCFLSIYKETEMSLRFIKPKKNGTFVANKRSPNDFQSCYGPHWLSDDTTSSHEVDEVIACILSVIVEQHMDGSLTNPTMTLRAAVSFFVIFHFPLGFFIFRHNVLAPTTI